MLAHAEVPEQGGSRIAIIMDGSPLFTGDAGSGESEIRRYILEHDLLEALVALPEQLFYNTGIATYVWLLTNRKARERRGRVQLIDATSFWSPMRRSLGNKRRQIPPEKAADVLQLLADFEDGSTRPVEEDGAEENVVVSRIFPTTHFATQSTARWACRLRDQIQPLLLPLPAAAPARGDPGRHRIHRSRHHTDAGRYHSRGSEGMRRRPGQCGDRRPLPSKFQNEGECRHLRLGADIFW